MATKELLYRTFGELLYVVAKSDGVIQDEEISKLEEILKTHPKGDEIRWSFDYEKDHETDIDSVYKKAIAIFSDHGPDEEYDFMIYALTQIAEASEGIDANEENVINNFSSDLLKRFKEDIDKLYL